MSDRGEEEEGPLLPEEPSNSDDVWEELYSDQGDEPRQEIPGAVSIPDKTHLARQSHSLVPHEVQGWFSSDQRMIYGFCLGWFPFISIALFRGETWGECYATTFVGLASGLLLALVFRTELRVDLLDRLGNLAVSTFLSALFFSVLIGGLGWYYELPHIWVWYGHFVGAVFGVCAYLDPVGTNSADHLDGEEVARILL